MRMEPPGTPSVTSSGTPTEQPDSSKLPTPSQPSAEEGSGDAAAMDVDIEGDVKLVADPTENGKQQPTANVPRSKSPGTYTNRFDIDICFEASKLPLDVAIFNSTRAAGGDEKIRKYLQAVLVVGGTGSMPGMSHALESRYVCISVSAYSYSISKPISDMT